MRHPNPEQWSDFVRGLTDSDLAATMSSHLQAACGRCERQVTALQAVVRVAESNSRFEPPPAALRAVNNLFRVQKLIESAERPRWSLTASFDSFLSPAAAGVRGDGLAARHLVYKSEKLSLDLQLHAGSRSESLRVRGLLLDSNEQPLTNVPAFLLEGGRIFSQDLSGSIGNFDLRGDSESSPRLCLLLDDDLVEVLLPKLSNELDESPEH